MKKYRFLNNRNPGISPSILSYFLEKAMKNDIYKPVLFQTTMRKHNRAEGGVVGMGQKDLRLNRTACLMQRMMMADFFALAYLRGNGISRHLPWRCWGFFCILPCVYLPRNDWNIWGRCGFGCFSPYFAPQSKYFGSGGYGFPWRGITRSFGDMPMRFRSAQRYTAGGIWPCFPIFSDMPIF